jgi:hypothetical protein
MLQSIEDKREALADLDRRPHNVRTQQQRELVASLLLQNERVPRSKKRSASASR